jgi:hypothetical protein
MQGTHLPTALPARLAARSGFLMRPPSMMKSNFLTVSSRQSIVFLAVERETKCVHGGGTLSHSSNHKCGQTPFMETAYSLEKTALLHNLQRLRAPCVLYALVGVPSEAVQPWRVVAKGNSAKRRTRFLSPRRPARCDSTVFPKMPGRQFPMPIRS